MRLPLSFDGDKINLKICVPHEDKLMTLGFTLICHATIRNQSPYLTQYKVNLYELQLETSAEKEVMSDEECGVQIRKAPDERVSSSSI